MSEYITKKDLLESMGISYGQLYRWKRMGLIPENWFIKRRSVTGQETVLPKEKSIKRIKEIQKLMERYSLDQIVDKFSFDAKKDVISFENMYKTKHLDAEYVNAVGNYFKKSGYTAIEYMMIICCARVAAEQHFSTRQFVDLLRYALPMAEKCEKKEMNCFIFAAGGDYHLALSDNNIMPILDSGLRVVGEFNLETMWDKLKSEI